MEETVPAGLTDPSEKDLRRGEKYLAYARGTAAEHLVEADLLLRGLPVTRPSVDYGDDLYAKFTVGWRSVQVKVRDSRCTAWRAYRKVTSEILAVVDSKTREIRYSSNCADPLPVELQ